MSPSEPSNSIIVGPEKYNIAGAQYKNFKRAIMASSLVQNFYWITECANKWDFNSCTFFLSLGSFPSVFFLLSNFYMTVFVLSCYNLFCCI